MPNIPAIQQFKSPDILNTASQLMNLKAMGKLGEAKKNAALTNKINAAREQASVKRKNSIEANDFTLNLLAGVNSSEDLDIAKEQLLARYPEYKGLVSQILPFYDTKRVDMIRNSLRTETQRLKLEEKDIKGFSPGSMLYKDGESMGQVPFAPSKPSHEVFEDQSGNQVYIEKGQKIPTGYKKVQTKGTQLTINTGDLSKTTTSKLENAVIEGTRNIQSFQGTKKLFKPEYLTIFGKGDKVIAEAADKLGIPMAGQKALIKERSKWFRQAKSDFIAYRKWATGVAGGEKELKEIATSFPDPVKNSPTQYQANLDSIEETTKRVLMLNTDFLREGINMNQPLDKIMEQTRGQGTGEQKEVTIKFDAQGNRIP